MSEIQSSKLKDQKTTRVARFFDAEAGGVGGIQPPTPPQDRLYCLVETKTTPLVRDAVFGPILSDMALSDKQLYYSKPNIIVNSSPVLCFKISKVR